MRSLALLLLYSLVCVGSAAAAPGTLVLLNGTSSAGKSSLAEVVVAESTNGFEVVSFDEFHRAYREKNQVTNWKPGQYQDFLHSLYRHARARADAGTNVLIDTVEFDHHYDEFCKILDCEKVVKVIVYCPPEDLLKRIEKRNDSGIAANRRPVLLSFKQYLEMYRLQSSPNELVVERTRTTVLRAALRAAGEKVNHSRQYQTLYEQYVKAFGIDDDREIVIVPKGRYDLVLNTRANTKKQNVRRLKECIEGRRGGTW